MDEERVKKLGDASSLEFDDEDEDDVVSETAVYVAHVPDLYHFPGRIRQPICPSC